MKVRNIRGISTVVFACLAIIGGACAAAQGSTPTSKLPPVNALVTNFYYENLPAAREWYVEKLGFRLLYDADWVIIVEVARGMQIALVDGDKGEMRAVQEKGTMLSIETDALEEWHTRVSKIEGINWYQSKKAGGDRRPARQIREHEDIREFRILDPGGYLIEFYQWKPGFRPKHH
jgi:catechol 2,3-dioxygenase-like lactoylglutathione lyase family enzyme